MRKLILDNSLSIEELKRIDEALINAGFKLIDITTVDCNAWIVTSDDIER